MRERCLFSRSASAALYLDLHLGHDASGCHKQSRNHSSCHCSYAQFVRSLPVRLDRNVIYYCKESQREEGSSICSLHRRRLTLESIVFFCHAAEMIDTSSRLGIFQGRSLVVRCSSAPISGLFELQAIITSLLPVPALVLW